MERQTKTTVSVREMGRILGLKKVESYYLVHKGYFDTILVEGKMRVVLDSFEEWYKNQDRYRKISGEPPGEKLRKMSWSAEDMADQLGVHKSVVYQIIRRDRIETVTVNGVMRVPRDVFREWYGKQDKYRTKEDREKEAELMEGSMSIPEAARLLDVPRDVIRQVIEEDKERTLKVITLAGRKRILTDSFEIWYARQKTYKKPKDRTDGKPYRPGKETYADSLKGKGKRKKKALPETQPSPEAGISLEEKSCLTVSEAAALTGIPPSAIRKRISTGKIRALCPAPGHVRIERTELESYLSVICPAAGTEDDPEFGEQDSGSEGREPQWHLL